MVAGHPVNWDDREFIREHGALAAKVGSVPGITNSMGHRRSIASIDACVHMT